MSLTMIKSVAFVYLLQSMTSVSTAFTPFYIIDSPTKYLSLHPVHQQATKMTSNDFIEDESAAFWKKQKDLAASMSESVDQSIKIEQREKYEAKASALVSETFYFSIIIFSSIWFFSSNPFTAFSYLLGALLGTAYTYGLSKYVQTLGGNAMDRGDVEGGGVGSARFAFLIILFIVVGRFRSEGLQEIPAISGFFTYQLSSLSQGLKENND